MRELREGLLTLRRSLGLIPVLLAVNLGLAALLAVPLGLALERDLRNTDAALRMTQGFDYDWWSEWSSRQTGPGRQLSPDILGLGFAVKNLDLLLKGHLPARLFSGLAAVQRPDGARAEAPSLDPLVLGLGVLSMLAHAFLAGGVLGVFKAPQGRWTLRGLVFGSGFYWGRLVRVSLLSLVAAGLVFALWAPLSRGAEHLARESVSETAALGWSFARYLLLGLGLGLVHMASSYAKIAVVLEDRASAVLAFLSGASFAARNLGRSALQYAAVALAGGALLGAFALGDTAFEPTGFPSQVVFLVLAEALIASKVALRLWLLASQVALYRRAAGAGPAFVVVPGMR
jgi:hypothetical protein